MGFFSKHSFCNLVFLKFSFVDKLILAGKGIKVAGDRGDRGLIDCTAERAIDVNAVAIGGRHLKTRVAFEKEKLRFDCRSKYLGTLGNFNLGRLVGGSILRYLGTNEWTETSFTRV